MMVMISNMINTCHHCYTVLHTLPHSFCRTVQSLSTINILLSQRQKQRPREMNLTTLLEAEPRGKPRQPASSSHAGTHCTGQFQGLGEIQPSVKGNVCVCSFFSVFRVKLQLDRAGTWQNQGTLTTGEPSIHVAQSYEEALWAAHTWPTIQSIFHHCSWFRPK